MYTQNHSIIYLNQLVRIYRSLQGYQLRSQSFIYKYHPAVRRLKFNYHNCLTRYNPSRVNLHNPFASMIVDLPSSPNYKYTLRLPRLRQQNMWFSLKCLFLCNFDRLDCIDSTSLHVLSIHPDKMVNKRSHLAVNRRQFLKVFNHRPSQAHHKDRSINCTPNKCGWWHLCNNRPVSCPTVTCVQVMVTYSSLRRNNHIDYLYLHDRAHTHHHMDHRSLWPHFSTIHQDMSREDKLLHQSQEGQEQERKVTDSNQLHIRSNPYCQTKIRYHKNYRTACTHVQCRHPPSSHQDSQLHM